MMSHSSEGRAAGVASGAAPLTLVTVFTVDPGKQQKLFELLVETADGVMRQVPGFISASIYRSLDGRTVVNYANWEDKASFTAMQAIPAAVAHLKAAAALAKFDPILCEVSRPSRKSRS